jgi:hypothetical protein
MGWARAVLALVASVAAGALLVSGGSEGDPRTPPGLAGEPAPFLGTAVVGGGGLTAAIDAYGDVVDLRAPGPAGRALIANPAERQAAGTVLAGTGIAPWVRIGHGAARPLWTADSVQQRYRRRTNVVVTTARFGPERVRVTYAAGRSLLACLIEAEEGIEVEMRSREPAAERRLRCDNRTARGIVRAALRDGRRWLARARPLAPDAPAWAAQMYGRSLLVLHALTERRTGAVAAGARDGWGYVWPRDAATAAIAFAAAGYRREAERTTRFLLGLGLAEAARFGDDGSPVPGRPAQGDPIGWVAAAAKASRLIDSAGHRARSLSPAYPVPWRNRADYQEGEPGNLLANALASGETGRRILTRFGNEGGLAREAGGEGGFDSAAAWAVQPFRRPALAGAVRRTLRRLAVGGNRFGLVPGEDWDGGGDPWSAPTAWSAWSLAALAREGVGPREAAADRGLAVHLLGALRRSATTAGTLPERVDFRTGIATSTTPLGWSHAFAVLALRELWPRR